MVVRRDGIFHGGQIQAGSLHLPRGARLLPARRRGLAARRGRHARSRDPVGSRGDRRDVSRRRCDCRRSHHADQPGARPIGADAADRSVCSAAPRCSCRSRGHAGRRRIRRRRRFSPWSPFTSSSYSSGSRYWNGRVRRRLWARRSRRRPLSDTPIGVYQLEWGSSIRYYADRRVLALPDPDAVRAFFRSWPYGYVFMLRQDQESVSDPAARSSGGRRCRGDRRQNGPLLEASGVGRRHGRQPSHARASGQPRTGSVLRPGAYHAPEKAGGGGVHG